MIASNNTEVTLETHRYIILCYVYYNILQQKANLRGNIRIKVHCLTSDITKHFNSLSYKVSVMVKGLMKRQ